LNYFRNKLFVKVLRLAVVPILVSGYCSALNADTDTYYFALGGDNDMKSYTNQVNYSGSINITLTNIPGGCDYDLELLDAGYNEVASSRNAENSDESISYPVSPSGAV